MSCFKRHVFLTILVEYFYVQNFSKDKVRGKEESDKKGNEKENQ